MSSLRIYTALTAQTLRFRRTHPSRSLSRGTSATRTATSTCEAASVCTGPEGPRQHAKTAWCMRACVCPGCLSPLPITSLKDYALTSALKDRRFSPIDVRELPHLHCTVSLLTNFEVACNLDDWSIGTHGVMIDYVDPAGQACCCREPSNARALHMPSTRTSQAQCHRRRALPSTFLTSSPSKAGTKSRPSTPSSASPGTPARRQSRQPRKRRLLIPPT